jgi:acyl carrier protein
MTELEIKEKVFEVFEESFEIETEEIRLESQIFDDLGLDSLDVVDLIVALQQKFGVRIRDNKGVRTIRTVGDVCVFIGTLTADNITSDS